VLLVIAAVFILAVIAALFDPIMEAAEKLWDRIFG
jgi:ABC-type nitrate/sulfonate/bicarbonate transport system permease component